MFLTTPEMTETVLEEVDAETCGGAKAEATIDETPFRFVHSHGFAQLLEALGGSLVVTTYQAGKLVAFRAREGRVSMLLRSYGKAMGVAVRPDRIAVATEYQIWTLH